jgi:hypothetical protein
MLLDLPRDLLADHVLPVVDDGDLARLRCTCTTVRSSVTARFGEAPSTYLMELAAAYVAFVSTPFADLDATIERVRGRVARYEHLFMWVDKRRVVRPQQQVADVVDPVLPNVVLEFKDPSVDSTKRSSALDFTIKPGPEPVMYVVIDVPHGPPRDTHAVKITYTTPQGGLRHLKSCEEFNPFATVDL